MGETLQKRLKMTKFESPMHEALLSLLVAASYLRSEIDRITGDFNLSSEQYNILRILKGAYPEGHACGAIAERMIDRSPDITRRIDSLEKQQLVERSRSTEDRRVVLTKITPKGIELLNELSPLLAEHQKKVAARLTEEEAHQLATLCEALIGEDAENSSSCESELD